MTGWQIDPAGVAAVLEDVGGWAAGTDGLAGVLTPDEAERAVSCVSWGRQYTRAVPRALSGLLSRVADDMGAVGARVETGAAGVGTAVSAYQAGQHDMDGQQRAVAVAGAAIHHDNPSDNLVVFGSPGTTVDHVSELDISQLNVYKALADEPQYPFGWDLVGELGIVRPFGNQVASNLPITDEWGGIRVRTDGASGHSEYMDLKTESLDNFSRVVAGQGGKVTKHPSQPKYLAPAPEWDDPFAPREF